MKRHHILPVFSPSRPADGTAHDGNLWSFCQGVISSPTKCLSFTPWGGSFDGRDLRLPGGSVSTQDRLWLCLNSHPAAPIFWETLVHCLLCIVWGSGRPSPSSRAPGCQHRRGLRAAGTGLRGGRGNARARQGPGGRLIRALRCWSLGVFAGSPLRQPSRPPSPHPPGHLWGMKEHSIWFSPWAAVVYLSL